VIDLPVLQWEHHISVTIATIFVVSGVEAVQVDGCKIRVPIFESSRTNRNLSTWI
jgi:hypothetical protein